MTIDGLLSAFASRLVIATKASVLSATARVVDAELPVHNLLASRKAFLEWVEAQARRMQNVRGQLDRVGKNDEYLYFRGGGGGGGGGVGNNDSSLVGGGGGGAGGGGGMGTVKKGELSMMLRFASVSSSARWGGGGGGGGGATLRTGMHDQDKGTPLTF